MKGIDSNLGSGYQVPPLALHVSIYFMEKGKTELDALDFFSHYECRQWLGRRGLIINNWKAAAWEWIWSRRNKF